MENGFRWGEPEKSLSSPERIGFHSVATGFPSTDFSGLYVKNVDSSAGSMFWSATGIFLSFLHAKVRRERLVYFIVINYNPIKSLFYKMTRFKWFA